MGVLLRFVFVKAPGYSRASVSVASTGRPNNGKHVIYGNTARGYRKELFIDLALHPGAVQAGNEYYRSPMYRQTQILK